MDIQARLPGMRIRVSGFALLFLLLLASALLMPGTARAQFDLKNPASVGVVILPFTLEYAEDKPLAERMEEVLSSRLRGRIGRRVVGSVEVLPALEDGIEACLEDRYCIPFMGSQFNVSLVVHVSLQKTGDELALEVDFYATGNGLRLAAERATFAVGDDAGLLLSFSGWIKELFDASLLVSAESLAGEGGVIGSEAGEEERLAAELKATRRKEHSSRRQDFESMRDAEVGFNRSDPTAELRAIAEGGEGTTESSSARFEPAERSAQRPEKRQKETSKSSYQNEVDLDDLDDLDERPKTRPKSKRNPNRGAGKSISLDARQSSGRSVRSYSEAQRAGVGVREYKRFTRTGLTMDAFLDRRWAYGGRFHIRAGGYYGLGWLTRRYATIIYIPATGQKTEEYAWESLGFNAVNPGFALGLGYAPLDFLQVELELSVMAGKQDLRNEYIWPGADVQTNRGLPPRSQNTAHVLMDLRARFFVNPMSRVKFSPGIGVTVGVMGGYEIDDDGPLQYSSRPIAAVVGLTPLVGMTAALSPYLSLYVDLLPTILLSRGAAKYEEFMLFNGGTERVGLQESDLNPPLDGCGGSQGEGFSSCPLLFRVGVGTMILF